MRRKWVRVLSGSIAAVLWLGSLPTGATASQQAKHGMIIHADEGLSLRYPSTRQKSLRAETNRSDRLLIVRCSGPIQSDWIEQMEQVGVEVGDYLPDFSFVVKLSEESDREALEQLGFVASVLPFQAGYKYSPDLLDALSRGDEQRVAVFGLDKHNDTREVETRYVTQRSVQDVISSDDIVAILPLQDRHPANDVARGIIHSDTLAETGYTGKNQIVGVADTGLDVGYGEPLHPDFIGRIVKMIPLGVKDDPSDKDGHGTHVAGSIVGTGKASDGKITGMAPDAKLIFHSMLDKKGYLVGEVSNILQEAYDGGARIHSDSWGIDDDGEYSVDSLQFDQFIWEHPDMTALVAAGNKRPRHTIVSSPATAKNVIAVGASESMRDEDDADNPDAVARFSMEGPTADDRLKPDVVAPGSMILSTRSQQVPVRKYEAGYENPYYAFLSGTSMATPIAAGGVAQVRQFLLEEGVENPSASLVKAMLITGADALPDAGVFSQGFGRVNLNGAIGTNFIDETTGLQTNDLAAYTIESTDASKPLTITLAWTDYPASPLALRTLVNDLNLIVTSPSGRQYHGNDFLAPDGEQADNLNNVEQVRIPEPEQGTYTVQVQAYNVPRGPQPFALAANAPLRSGTDMVKQRKVVKKATVSSNAGETRYRDYNFSVQQAGELNLTLDWTGNANLNLYVYNEKNRIVAKAVSSKHPKALQYLITAPGNYKVKVRASSGGEATYKLTVQYPVKRQ